MLVTVGGSRDQHVNQTSVLACSPLSCLAVACVTMVTGLYVCMCVSLIERLLLLVESSVWVLAQPDLDFPTLHP